MLSVVPFKCRFLFFYQLRQEGCCFVKVPYVEGQVDENVLSRTGNPRIIHCNLAFILWLQEILESSYLTFLDEIRIINDVSRKTGDHSHRCLVFIDERKPAVAPILSIRGFREHQERFHRSQETCRFHGCYQGT